MTSESSNADWEEAVHRVEAERVARSGALDLQYLSIGRLPEGIETLDWLTTLDCSNTWVADLAPIARLTGLKSIDCSLTEVTDLAPLRELPVLEILRCSFTRATDFAPLIGCTALKVLHCSACQVADAAVFGELHALRELDCSVTQITDLGPIAGLPRLEILHCSGNKIADLTPLRRLRGLKKLRCARTQISDLAPLSELKSLESLDCSNTQVTDLTPLSQLLRLKYLRFDFTPVADCTPISRLPALETLDCEDTGIIDLEAFSRLVTLKTFSCDGNEITDLSPLVGLAALESLSFAKTQVTDLTPVAQLQALKTISLNNTQIADLTPLAKLPMLQSLFCWGTKVADLSPLENMATLTELDCDGTQVMDLAPLKRLRACQSLDCSNTQVADLSPLAELAALRSLNFTNTEVTDLSPLGGLGALESIEFTATRVADISTLAILSKLEKIDCSRTAITDLMPLVGHETLRTLQCGDLQLEGNHEALWDNPALRNLVLTDSTLGTVPVELLDDNCLGQLRGYFRSLANGAVDRRAVKLFLLGNGSVGKTQIGRRLRDKPFEPEHCTTHGIDVHRLPLEHEGRPIALSLWDFRGQPLYHGTHALFLRNGSLYLLAWAPDHETGQHDDGIGGQHDNLPLCYWAATAHQAGGDGAALLLTETHVDEEGRESLQIPIDDDDIRWCAWRRRLNVGSATGRGISELRDAIAAAADWLLDRRGQQVIAVGWKAVIDAVAALRGKQKSLTRGEFDTLCAVHGVTVGIDTLLLYLDRSGDLFYRPGHFGDTVVIDQNWLLDAVYALFEREHCIDRLRQAQGRFRRADVGEWLWDADHSIKEQHLFLSWMTSCGLCFPVDNLPWGERLYVAPSALPPLAEMATVEARAWQEGAEWTPIAIRYRVALMHDGIVHGMITSLGREMRLDADYWDRGVKIFDAASGVRLRLICARDDEGWGGSIDIEAQHPPNSGPHRAQELIAAVRKLVETTLAGTGLPSVPEGTAPIAAPRRDETEPLSLGTIMRVPTLPEPPEPPTANAIAAKCVPLFHRLKKIGEAEMGVLVIALAMPAPQRPSDKLPLASQGSQILGWAADNGRLDALEQALNELDRP